MRCERIGFAQHADTEFSMKSEILLSLVTLIFVSMSVAAEISPEKRAEIEKMLRLTGMERMMNQIKGQMIANSNQRHRIAGFILEKNRGGNGYGRTD